MFVLRSQGYNSLEEMMPYIIGNILDIGHPVDTGHWQAMKGVPQTLTQEMINVAFTARIPATTGSWAAFCQPNLPWAESQFIERISGDPVNPGDTYQDWPYYKGNVEQHKEPGQFSHTYAERFWPLYAGREEQRGLFTSKDGVKPEDMWPANRGIRYRYGDLHDVVALLWDEPYSRQAYLPIFFPEDTGAHDGQRIPCSLGYQFLYRREELHVKYDIRSCDAIRHFKDDVYMAGRLVHWMLHELSTHREFAEARPGTLTMTIGSLHVFQAEVPTLRNKYGLAEND